MAQHATKTARFQAITANTVQQGEVVYFAKNSTWQPRLDQAAIVEGNDAAQALLQKAQQPDAELYVVNMYLFEVVKTENGFKPLSVRETIRAAGPTTHLNFGKQAQDKQAEDE